MTTTAELQAEGQRIAEGLEEEREAELARRSAAMNAFAQAAPSWAAQVRQSQPVITNCRQWGYQGSMLTCTTY